MTLCDRMRVLSLALACIICGCTASVRQNQATLDATWEEISRSEDVPESEIIEIIHARGGKDRGEIWKADRHEGYIRIQKEYSDGRTPLPGAAVEFWYQDANGQWRAALTA